MITPFYLETFMSAKSVFSVFPKFTHTLLFYTILGTETSKSILHRNKTASTLAVFYNKSIIEKVTDKVKLIQPET